MIKDYPSITYIRRIWRWTFTIKMIYGNGKEQEIERINLFETHDTTSNWKFKGYKDNGLEHIWIILFRKLSLCFLTLIFF